MRPLSRPILIVSLASLVSACGAVSPTPAPSGAAPASVAASGSAGSGGVPSSTSPITIGLLLPYTESAVNSDRGLAQKRAAELYVTQHGGMVGGRSASFAYADESITGSLDVTKAHELISQHADVVLGLLGDDGAAAVRDDAASNAVPLLITGASGDALTRTAAKPSVFRVAASNWQISEPLGEWAAAHGATSCYLVHAPDTFGTESAAAFAAGLGKHGGTTTGNVAATPGGDWAKLVAAVRAQSAKDVFAAFEGPDAIAFIDAWAKAGMAAAGYTLYGPGPLADPDVLASVKGAATGITTASSWSATLPGSDNGALVAAFPKAYTDEDGNPSPATPDVATMWDAMRALDGAVATAGTGADALAQAIGAESVPGVGGTLAFDPQSHNVVLDVYIRRVAATGAGVSDTVVDTVPKVADPGR
jgi:branched-chain amino acid transport system substrate-binding protein